MPPMSRTSFCSGRRSTTGNGRLGVELGRVGAVHAGDVAGELGHGDLHAEADAEVGHAVLAGEARGADLALDAAHAEAAGDQDPVALGELVERLVVGELLGVDPAHLDLAAVVGAAVAERLDHRQVGVLELACTCRPGRSARRRWPRRSA